MLGYGLLDWLNEPNQQQMRIREALSESERSRDCDWKTRVTTHAVDRDSNHGRHVRMQR
jgi:hypothetical protein